MTHHSPAPARPRSRTAGIAVAFAAMAAVLFVIAPPAHACSCVPPPPVAVVLDEAPLAFVGTQVARESNQQMGAVLTISVSEVYIGEATTLIDLSTGSGDADCGVDLTGAGPVGFTPSLVDGSLYVGLCGGTVPADQMRQVFAERGVDPSGPVSDPAVDTPLPETDTTSPPDTPSVPDITPVTVAATGETTPPPTRASSFIWLVAVAAAAGVAGAGYLMARRRR